MTMKKRGNPHNEPPASCHGKKAKSARPTTFRARFCRETRAGRFARASFDFFIHVIIVAVGDAPPVRSLAPAPVTCSSCPRASPAPRGCRAEAPRRSRPRGRGRARSPPGRGFRPRRRRRRAAPRARRAPTGPSTDPARASGAWAASGLVRVSPERSSPRPPRRRRRCCDRRSRRTRRARTRGCSFAMHWMRSKTSRPDVARDGPGRPRRPSRRLRVATNARRRRRRRPSTPQSLINKRRCRRYTLCRSRWSPDH